MHQDSKLKLLASLCKCPACGSANLKPLANSTDKALRCEDCKNALPFENGVLNCIKNISASERNTAKHYGEGWQQDHPNISKNVANWHYDEMIKVTGGPANKNGVGFEAGCGHGKDTVRLALSNPNSTLVSLDLSEGVEVAAARCKALGIDNVVFIRASLLEIPVKENLIDWTYSFGVLHHTPSPLKCMHEIQRISKQDASLTMYLYSDLSEFPVKKFFLKPVTVTRSITKRLPLWALRLLCVSLAPFVFLLLTVPALALRIMGQRRLSQQIPHHHNKSVGSVVGELYDRLGAQVEFRFNRNEFLDLHEQAGFSVKIIDQIPIWRGWVSYADNNASLSGKP